jgi:hypothetical protein
MIELLISSTFATALSSTIIGQSIIGPNLLRTDYLTPTNQVITIQEVIQEDPNNQPCNL